MSRYCAASPVQTGSHIRASATPSCNRTRTGPEPPEASAQILSAPAGTIVRIATTLTGRSAAGHDDRGVTMITGSHQCPGADPAAAARLTGLLAGNAWFM